MIKQDKIYVGDELYYAIICIMNIIEDLENYRLENKISQEELAKLLGVHFTTVSRWLNGHRKPNKIQEFHIRKLLSEGNR